MKKIEPCFELLQDHIQKIISVPEEAWPKILDHFTIRYIRKKEYLLRPTEICRHESFIAKGLFQSGISDESGKHHSLNFPHENWWVGDLKSFRTEKGSCMEIQALENSVLLQISKNSLEHLYNTYPIFNRFFRILNENSAIAHQDRIIHNLSLNTEDRYEEFQKKYSSLHNRLSQKKIASFLGVTPEYFNQLLKQNLLYKS